MPVSTPLDDAPEKKLRPDPDLPLAVAAAGRVRLCTRLASTAIMLICVALGGPLWPDWLLGSFWGVLLVEINLSLLLRLLVKSPNWQGRSMAPTLLRFYLLFGLTAVFCVLVVRNHWGEPLAFLLGLLSFFVGLSLGLLSLLVKKADNPGHD